ncbi:TspO/MBR family protein [Sphingomonas canadensis]|uniref:TspO/MBR family protein n=1 Tax=Sphingomonas canadensis TaxID=1219257 RepID=A0ABW3HDA9_9SPHN|nr:TspO/MBR family protein [Sphingomonas canadensis]MCW3837026.1 tryptophan-rich sensory protein [Sphingomonas canadensis]
MREIASKGQLRLAYLRWAVVTVPFILLLGFTSARLLPAGQANPWYRQLALPPDMPEEWMFPAAWAAIYVLLGLALAMIINARGSTLRGPAIVVFTVLMGGNFLWPLLFFGMHQIFWTLVLVGGLGALALVALILFGRIRIAAGLLMVPYIAWLGYAGFLLYQLDRMNPNAESIVPSRSSDQILVI